MSQDDELRQEQRLNCHETTFIEVVSGTVAEYQPSKIVICNTLDVSANGLQVSMDQKLQIGAIHQLSIQLDQPDERFHLVAEVKWCQPSDDESEFVMGLALFESEDTDIERWKESIATRFA